MTKEERLQRAVDACWLTARRRDAPDGLDSDRLTAIGNICGPLRTDPIKNSPIYGESVPAATDEQIIARLKQDKRIYDKGCEIIADLEAEVESLHEAMSTLLVHNEDDDIYSVIGLGSVSFGGEQQLSERQDRLVRDALCLQRASTRNGGSHEQREHTTSDG